MTGSEPVAVDAPLSQLGEGPIWCARDRALYWVDVVGKALFRLQPSTGKVDVRSIPYAPSAIIPYDAGGLLLITKKGMALMDFDKEGLDSISIKGIDFSREVFNDAACDKNGLLWVGTRDINAKEPRGNLYSMGRDFSLAKHTEGLMIANGLGWSPDWRTMYHADSRPGRIDVYDFDADKGAISNRRVMLDYSKREKGRPDGCTVDAEGGLWVAEVDAWRVARYLPDGSFHREIKVPTRKPTSVMFGGDDLDTLYITSMRFGLSPEELADQPLAGSLFAVKPGPKGRVEPSFASR